MDKSSRLDPLVEKVLRVLSGYAAASEIVLGGYLALQHHVDYRTTHDIDAWWLGRASPAAEKAIIAAMQQVAAEEGFDVKERRFGETLSVELSRSGRKHFAFQIAVRSVMLEEPELSEWPPVLIESLVDTVGSKMNALVNRGAPRDMLDVKAIVGAGLMDAEQCWAIWQRKNPDDELGAARLKVLGHLQSLATRRPLHSIKDPAERVRAERVREWLGNIFLRNDDVH